MLGAYRITEAIAIARPPEAVFDLISDPENDPKWCELVPEAVFTGDRQTGLGSYEFVQRIPGGRVTPGWGEITQLVRPSLMRSRSGFDRTEILTTFDLEAFDGGTRVTHTNSVRWRGWQRLIHPLLQRGTRRTIVAQLEALKQLLEEAAPSASSR